MENVHLSVIPAQAGIQWLQVLGDPCLRRDDGEEAFSDTRGGGESVRDGDRGQTEIGDSHLIGGDKWLSPNSGNVIPAKAGIQWFQWLRDFLSSQTKCNTLKG
jgi:hypothetical protein